MMMVMNLFPIEQSNVSNSPPKTIGLDHPRFQLLEIEVKVFYTCVWFHVSIYLD